MALSTTESYIKAGGSYLVGVASAKLVDNIVLDLVLYETFNSAFAGSHPGIQGLFNALVETSAFLLVSALIGPRLSTNSQLLFTIGLWGSGSQAELMGQTFATWASNKV